MVSENLNNIRDTLKAVEAIIKRRIKKLKVKIIYPCVVCGPFLSSSSDLNKHIGSKHVKPNTENFLLIFKTSVLVHSKTSLKEVATFRT